MDEQYVYLEANVNIDSSLFIPILDATTENANFTSDISSTAKAE